MIDFLSRTGWQNKVPIKIVNKGWGWEKWIVNNDLYCGKLLFVHRSKRCSAHYHEIKDETFFLLNGRIKLEYAFEDEWKENQKFGGIPEENRYWAWQTILTPGDNFYIPPRMLHRFTGLEDSLIVEFSTHHEDSDSYRLIKGD